MNARVISSLVKKDIMLFFQNKFISVITLAGIVAFILVYYLMPSTVDETVELGLYAPILPPAITQLNQEGLELVRADTEGILKELVQNGDVMAGLSISLVDREITVYFSRSIPSIVREQIDIFLEEISYLVSGIAMPFEVKEEVIGTDMSGQQIALRDRLKPMLAVLILIFETIGLANLIAEEIENRTLQAISVTPMTAAELYVAKGITGGLLAFTQALLFMALVRGLRTGGIIIIVALILGAFLSVGLGFLIGAISKDFLSVLYIGILILIPLFLPAISVLSPGVASGWVKLIPSFYLVDVVSRASNYGAGWTEVWRSLGTLAVIDVVLIRLGILTLGRKNTWA